MQYEMLLCTMYSVMNICANLESTVTALKLALWMVVTLV